MSIREPRWDIKHTFSTPQSKLGFLVLSHTPDYVGPLLWEIYHWSKFLFNIAPMIKHSIPDDAWPARRTLTCYVILRDYRDYWCPALSPLSLAILVHANLTSYHQDLDIFPKGSLWPPAPPWIVPSHECQWMNMPQGVEVAMPQLSPLSWGDPEMHDFFPSQSPAASSSCPPHGHRLSTHLHWLPYPCRKRCCGVMSQINNCTGILILDYASGGPQTKIEPNTASASLSVTLCCCFILIFGQMNLQPFFFHVSCCQAIVT